MPRRVVDPWLPSLAAVLVVSLVSLVGAIAGAALFRRHAVIMTLVALAAGSLLGDAVLHLLPEAVELAGGMTAGVGFLVLGGFGLFFLFESVLRHGHAHGEVLQADHDDAGAGPARHAIGSGHSPHAHAHPGHVHVHDGDDHTHGPQGHHDAPAPSRDGRIAPFAWMNLLGDALHNFLDGIVIAAAFAVDVKVGVATTVAVILHEIPQELGDFAVLLRAGMAPRRAILFNLLSALVAVVGAVLFLSLPFDADQLQAIALPIAAGGFLYIAAADLIPELHHHTGDRHVVNIVLGLAAGIGAMAGLLFLE